VLQERLNKDTEELAQTIIQQPKNLISALTRIAVKVFILYRLSPQLFWLGISIPVPACVILNTLGWRLVRKSHKKISKVNDQAAAQTSELLREINTVRQFGMEREEQRRYKMVATWRQQLERAMGTLVILSRFAALSFSLTWKASPLQRPRGCSLSAPCGPSSSSPESSTPTGASTSSRSGSCRP